MSKTTKGLRIEREAQSPQKPSARVGDNQEDRIPTGEGSLLGSPSTAGEKKGKTPHL